MGLQAGPLAPLQPFLPTKGPLEGWAAAQGARSKRGAATLFWPLLPHALRSATCWKKPHLRPTAQRPQSPNPGSLQKTPPQS